MTKYPQSNTNRINLVESTKDKGRREKSGHGKVPFRRISSQRWLKSLLEPSKLGFRPVMQARIDISRSKKGRKSIKLSEMLPMPDSHVLFDSPLSGINVYLRIIGIVFNHFRGEVRRRSNFRFRNGLPNVTLTKTRHRGIAGEHHFLWFLLTFEYPKSQILSNGRTLPSSKVFSNLISRFATPIRWQ